MASLINRSACKKAILSLAKTRAYKFTRVGSDVYEHLDIVVLNAMKAIVASHPSIGKTIMMESRKRVKREDDADDAFMKSL